MCPGTVDWLYAVIRSDAFVMKPECFEAPPDILKMFFSTGDSKTFLSALIVVLSLLSAPLSL